MQEAERYGGKKDIFGGKRMIRRVAKKDLERTTWFLKF